MKYIINILFLSAVAFYSCTERLDIELDSSPPILVVYGYITTDTVVHEIKLSTTSDFFTGVAPPAVSNATVYIESNGVEVILNERDETGIYETPSGYFGVPGQTYNLTISNIDINKDGENETYIASSYLPHVVSIDFVLVTDAEVYDMHFRQVTVFFQDSINTRDFYMFKTYKNDTLLSDTLDEIAVIDDMVFNGTYFGYPYDMLVDTMISPHDTIINSTETVNIGDVIQVEMAGITEEYYQYMLETITTSYGTSPFSGPPANPITNITGDAEAFGFFTAFSVTRLSTVYTGIVVKNR